MFQDGWVRDSRFTGAFVTVTGVTMSPDLAHATVHVSVFSEDAKISEGVMHALGDARRDLRRELGTRLSIRHTPEIHFSHDASAAYGEKMERLLKQIRTDTPVAEPIEPGSDTDADETTNPDADPPIVPSEPDDPDALPGDPTNPDAKPEAP